MNQRRQVNWTAVVAIGTIILAVMAVATYVTLTGETQTLPRPSVSGSSARPTGPSAVRPTLTLLPSSSPSESANELTEASSTDHSSTKANIEQFLADADSVARDPDISFRYGCREDVESGEYALNRIIFPQSIGLSACSYEAASVWIEFNVPSECASFLATMGLADTSPSSARATLTVLLDGVKSISQEYGLRTTRVVQIDVEDVLRVRLQASHVARHDFGRSAGHDWSIR